MSEVETAPDNRPWLEEVLPLHSRLCDAVLSLIANILKNKEIEYLSIAARPKTIEGALEKIKRKEYTEPREQLTDLSGIRVITYLEDHVNQITSTMREIFDVDESNSLDRSSILGEDKIGYRSTHLVCQLGRNRARLPEYEDLGGLKFELQIRTVLQHAWAELAHDRSFKFGFALPRKIQRKLNLYSGTLELVDNAFDEIAKEIDAYKASLENKSIQQISETEIDSISVAKFVEEIKATLSTEIRENMTAGVFNELRKFGINTIGDLESLLTSEFKRDFEKHRKATTSIGTLRSLMMYADLERYFSLGRKFGFMQPDTVAFLEEKYGDRVREILDKVGIEIQGSNPVDLRPDPPAGAKLKTQLKRPRRSPSSGT